MNYPGGRGRTPPPLPRLPSISTSGLVKVSGKNAQTRTLINTPHNKVPTPQRQSPQAGTRLSTTACRRFVRFGFNIHPHKKPHHLKIVRGHRLRQPLRTPVFIKMFQPTASASEAKAERRSRVGGDPPCAVASHRLRELAAGLALKR